MADCTGTAASWCPVHGDCTCPREEDGSPVVRRRQPQSEHVTVVYMQWWMAPHEVVHDSACPLHGEEGAHCLGGDHG